MNIKLFGTDGIRGPYGSEGMNDHIAYRLGLAIGQHLKNQNNTTGSVILGRDPRISGENLQRACSAGIQNAGFQALDAGTLPTPALAFGTAHLKAKMGVMITASHNPASDNGLKLFSAKGGKLSIPEENEMESLILATEPDDIYYEKGKEIEVCHEYVKNICKFFPKNFLAGKQVLIDTANGATCSTSPEVFSRLGADVICLHSGEGIINQKSGSEHPEDLIARITHTRACLGVAHDGDGDRAVFIDPSGKLINGDQILGLLAKYAHQHHRLREKGFVATVHSNSGLDASLASIGVELHRADVGDRNVSDLMREVGCNWGGESSGHVVAHDYLPTGDGLFTALSIACALIESNKTLTEITKWVELWPSKSSSFGVDKKIPLDDCPEIQECLSQSIESLGDQGRILLRYSGTEPRLRLLVEAKDEKLVKDIFSKMQGTIEKTL
ncbi:MAG: phosphoglucosamine mutase [Opitutales bacterium]|nr:phosphoglucosamine mutase [Opitutales bacterium]